MVDIPIGSYSGQKPKKLVTPSNIPPAAKMKDVVPVTIPVSESATNTAAVIILIIRSAEPIFFFIFL